MPALSMFYVIIIRMQSEKGGKHNKPHLHAVYNEHEIVMDFTGNILFIPYQAVKAFKCLDCTARR